MNFSHALEQIKIGRKMTRGGWNGRGMFVCLQRGYPNGVPVNAQTAGALGIPEKTIVKVLPYLLMKTADGSIVPWLASQTDILANDWRVAPEDDDAETD